MVKLVMNATLRCGKNRKCAKVASRLEVEMLNL